MKITKQNSHMIEVGFVVTCIIISVLCTLAVVWAVCVL